MQNENTEVKLLLIEQCEFSFLGLYLFSKATTESHV